MDIGRSLSFAFEDEAWINKLGIAAVITYVPLLNLAWTGYLIEVLRNTANEELRPLPDWSDLGGQFMRGLTVTLGLLVYWLPVLLVGCLALSTMMIPAFFTDSDAAEELAAASGGVIVISLCCAALYALVFSFYTPAAMIHYARRERFVALFEFGQILGVITHNPADYLLAWIVTLGVNLVIGLLTTLVWTVASVIPCVGWIAGMAVSSLAVVWAGVIYAHLFGQAARRLATDLPFSSQPVG